MSCFAKWAQHVSLLLLGLAALLALLRLCRARRLADCVLAVNMLGTLVLLCVVLLALLFREAYVLDIALALALLNFLAIVVLCRTFGRPA